MSKTKLICNCNKTLPLDAKALAAAQLARLTGGFKKPKFFVYNEKICAHSRSEITGCTL